MNGEQADRLIAALERQASASEELNALAKNEREVGEAFVAPPLCPHCGTFNPDITSGGREGSGEFAGFVLVAFCTSCNNTFYAMAQGWLCFQTRDEVQQERERRLNGDKP